MSVTRHPTSELDDRTGCPESVEFEAARTASGTSAASRAGIAAGVRVRGHLNRPGTEFTGVVALTYAVDLHGFAVPMVKVEGDDARVRYAMLGDVERLDSQAPRRVCSFGAARAASFRPAPAHRGDVHRHLFVDNGTQGDLCEAHAGWYGTLVERVADGGPVDEPRTPDEFFAMLGDIEDKRAALLARPLADIAPGLGDCCRRSDVRRDAADDPA